MAEAHSAVAFRLAVTSRGVDVSLNHRAIRAVVASFFSYIRRRAHHFKVSLVLTGMKVATGSAYIAVR